VSSKEVEIPVISIFQMLLLHLRKPLEILYQRSGNGAEIWGWELDSGRNPSVHISQLLLPKA